MVEIKVFKSLMLYLQSVHQVASVDTLIFDIYPLHWEKFKLTTSCISLTGTDFTSVIYFLVASSSFRIVCYKQNSFDKSFLLLLHFRKFGKLTK